MSNDFYNIKNIRCKRKTRNLKITNHKVHEKLRINLALFKRVLPSYKGISKKVTYNTTVKLSVLI